MSHDQNFKNLIVDYPRESIAFFAAVEAHAVDAGARIVPIRPIDARGAAQGTPGRALSGAGRAASGRMAGRTAPAARGNRSP
jgi:hypothetical protein